MMKTQIPGWGELEIKNLILDFNGTIAKDGKVLEGVKELLGKIHEAGIEIYVVTADTNGTVAAECETLPVHVKIFGSDTVARDKRCLCQELGCRNTASIGNGRNDIQVFPASVLSIAVSAMLTFAVSLLVSLMVARKNKKIDMVEALKGAE